MHNTGMVVLADELLESFFDEDLQASWQLETLIVEEKVVKAGAAGWFDTIVSTLVTDENKDRLNSLADLAGRSLNIQQISSVPALGKLDSVSSLLIAPRGSLLSRNPSTSPQPNESSTSSAILSNPLSAASMRDTPAYPPPFSATPLPPLPNPWSDVNSMQSNDEFETAARALERPRFSEDAATEDHAENDEEEEKVEGTLLDEVDGFILERSKPTDDI